MTVTSGLAIVEPVAHGYVGQRIITQKLQNPCSLSPIGVAVEINNALHSSQMVLKDGRLI